MGVEGRWRRATTLTCNALFLETTISCLQFIYLHWELPCQNGPRKQYHAWGAICYPLRGVANQMSDLIAVLDRLYRTNLGSSKLLGLSEWHWRKLEPWPVPTNVSVRRLKPFDRFDIPPTKDQLHRAAATYMRCHPGPVIVNDDGNVLLGQLRVTAIKEHFGPQSRVHAVRYSQLSEA